MVKRLGLPLAVLLALAVYVGLGSYRLGPDEEAVVLLLGRHVRTAGPGLNFHLLGLETVERERLIVEREEFGFRTVTATPPQEYEDRPDEKRMLTGDTNVVDAEWVVQWQISDIRDFRFNAYPVPALIRQAGQAAMREVVARRPTDDVLTQEKLAIQGEARERMQQVLDGYGAGVRVVSVQLQEVQPPQPTVEAFRDVVSSEQDEERLILEAQAYADQVVPRARGEAEQVENEARAYREERILEARGEASRFNALLEEYREAPRVTRERLYIETLEAILPGMEKVIIEEGHSERVLPYLPLPARGSGK